ncbi:hypothetical protein [Marinobacterium stanieri]|uniref:hypothetical protein n=1 Tax=Marinobacterium stanieri TaxID=49186 RepID=UPI000255889E|nr:hypothetical protein [Marinobacterium stanieri]
MGSPSDSGKQSDIELSHLGEYAVKGEIYMITLCFTLLTFSVQHAPEKSEMIECTVWVQVLGWGLLAISGVLGLLILRIVSRRFAVLLGKKAFEESLKADSAYNTQKRIHFGNMYDDFDDRLRQRNNVIWKLQMLGLVVGILCLAVSRIADYLYS